jgi:hypothetical protein
VSTRLDAARAMTETELQDRIRGLCADLGLTVQHIHDPRRSWLPGWPDLVIIGTRAIWRELKSEHGSLTPEQRDVGNRLTRAGQDWAIWRPRDLLDGTIGRQLADVAAIQPRLWEDTPDVPASRGGAAQEGTTT